MTEVGVGAAAAVSVAPHPLTIRPAVGLRREGPELGDGPAPVFRGLARR